MPDLVAFLGGVGVGWIAVELHRRLTASRDRHDYLRGFEDGYSAAERDERERATIFAEPDAPLPPPTREDLFGDG